VRSKKKINPRRSPRRGQSVRFKTFTKEQLARQFARQKEKERSAKLGKLVRGAFSKFRPKKSERGSIVFINRSGKRDRSGKVGYAVHITRTGKKRVVRQYDRKSGKVERVPKARKISSIDVSRVRNKKAQKIFLQAHVNKVAAGSLRKIRRSGKVSSAKDGKIDSTGTRFAGSGKYRRIDIGSEAAQTIGKELVKAFRSVRSGRDFLVTFGIHVKKGNQRYWFETSRRIVRRDKQTLLLSEARAFVGREIYAFIARQLLAEGLVMRGSAQFISRLEENKGKKRKDWTKDGFEWGGAGAEDVTIENVEWRFDQNTFGRA
jgi:hypothetical protein